MFIVVFTRMSIARFNLKDKGLGKIDRLITDQDFVKKAVIQFLGSPDQIIGGALFIGCGVMEYIIFILNEGVVESGIRIEKPE